MRGLISDDNSACLDELRLTKTVFLKLFRLLQEKAHLKPTKYAEVPEMVAVFLGILGHDKKTRTQKHAFKRSTRAVSKHFNTVLTLRDDLYVKPKPITGDDATSRFRFFENCFGALDGLHIPLHVKEDWKPCFRTEKDNYPPTSSEFVMKGKHDRKSSLQIPVITGETFSGVIIRSRARACDSSALTRKQYPFKVRAGCYYLCDNEYTNCEGFLAPHRSVLYHLKEWGVVPTAPQNAREYFNMWRHLAARNDIERAWGLTKIRWGILCGASFYPIKTAMCIVACALLHSFIPQQMRVDPWECKVPEGYQNSEADEIHTIGGTPEWNALRDNLAEAWTNSRRV